MRNRKLGIDYSSDDFEGCPVETTLDIIGGKWKGILLYHLIDGKKRFNRVSKTIPKNYPAYAHATIKRIGTGWRDSPRGL